MTVTSPGVAAVPGESTLSPEGAVTAAAQRLVDQLRVALAHPSTGPGSIH